MATLTFYLPTVIFISLVGGFLPLLRELSQKALALLLSFSAGVLLGAIFFHMLPETGRVHSDNMGWAILTGFLLIFAMERFVFVHACEERDCDIHPNGDPGFPRHLPSQSFGRNCSRRGSHPTAVGSGRTSRRHRSQDA